MTTAAIYARQSVANEAGVERQEALARAFATSKGWTVTHVFSDNAISGAKDRRPGLDRLLATVEAHAVDCVVMMNVDRLSRGTISTSLALQQRILAAGVQLWYYQTQQQVVLATATDELKGAIDAYGARDYRDQIRKKTRAALQQKAKAGHATGNRLYGYRSVAVGDHTERQVFEPEAAIVRRIFKAYVDGRGTRGICRDLTTEHVPGPRGRGWSQATVRDLLRNHTYAGRLYFSRWENVDGGPRRQRPQSEWVTAEVPALRILPAALWQAAQDRAAELGAVYLRKQDGTLQSKPVNSVESKYLLTGLAECAACGGPMGIGARTKAGQRTTFLRCRKNSDKGLRACTNGRVIPLDRAEAAVLSAIEALVADEVIVAHVYPTLSAPKSVSERQAEAQALALSLATAERTVHNLTEAIAAGGGAIPVLVSKLKDAERTRATLATQVAAAQAQAGTLDLTLEAFGQRVEQAARGFASLARQRPELVRARLKKLLTNGRLIFHPADASGKVRFEGELDYAPILADLNLPTFRTPPASGTGRTPVSPWSVPVRGEVRVGRAA